jgi:MoxR-like ATPase
MAPLNKPFSLGAGSPPPELAGRDELIERAQLILRRVRAGRYELSLMLVGLRGVGKTALLNKVRAIAAFTVPLFDEFMYRTMSDWKPSRR